MKNKTPEKNFPKANAGKTLGNAGQKPSQLELSTSPARSPVHPQRNYKPNIMNPAHPDQFPTLIEYPE